MWKVICIFTFVTVHKLALIVSYSIFSQNSVSCVYMKHIFFFSDERT